MKLVTRPKPEPAPKNRLVSHHPLGGGINGFTAFDGEGCTIRGQHRYVLLGVGQDQIQNRDGLRFSEIMEFLYPHYRPKIAYTGFYLSYDFSNWFATLPENRARMLLTSEGIAMRQRRNLAPRNGSIPLHLPPHPVEYDKWQFDMLGAKRFKLRPKMCKCEIVSCRCEGKAPWMYLCDTGGYFQTSLINVINPEKWETPIVTDDEYAIIIAGKIRRDKAQLDGEMEFYNRLENEILERVLREYDSGLRAVGVNLSASKWFGPGQAAQAWLKDKAPTGEEIAGSIPQWFLEAARMSYFGGWFEIMMHGIIKGTIHEYDINSAYPYVIASLPCLLHGTYSRGIGNPGHSDGKGLTLVRASVRTRAYPREYRKRNDYIGAMLHRDRKGRISRPMITEGWFWLHELEAAQRAGCINRNVRFLEWVSYEPCNCPAPMRGIADLYQHRLSMGKDSPMGKAAKLVYNSGYGKFAQSVGMPVFGNPIYASLITAGCRTQILDAIASHPKGKADVAMVATDAVYFLSEHPSLPLSERLGEWDHSLKHNITLFKPGVYWDDKARKMVTENKTPTFKARGINAADFAGELGRIDREFGGWNGTPPPIERHDGSKAAGWPSVEFRPSFAMTTALQALRRSDWNQAAHVDSPGLPVTQSASPFDKRCEISYDRTMDVYRSQPPWYGLEQNGDNPASYPYEKRFGMEDPWSEERMSVNGVTPDGYVGDEYRFLVGKE